MDPGQDAGEIVPIKGKMPRWFKVSAIVAGVLLAVFLVLHLAGIGGPGLHRAP